jgi:hypothetical protein
MVNRGGFSWKRAVGITRAKQRVSRATGIPWTRSGRQRKVGRLLTGGCVVLPGIVLVLFALGIVMFCAIGCGALSNSLDLIVTTSDAAVTTSGQLPSSITVPAVPSTTTRVGVGTNSSPAATTTTEALATSTEKSTTTALAPVAEDDGPTVYITATGQKYHRATCRYLNESNIPIGLSEAKGLGYDACKVCKPEG